MRQSRQFLQTEPGLISHRRMNMRQLCLRQRMWNLICTTSRPLLFLVRHFSQRVSYFCDGIIFLCFRVFWYSGALHLLSFSGRLFTLKIKYTIVWYCGILMNVTWEFQDSVYQYVFQLNFTWFLVKLIECQKIIQVTLACSLSRLRAPGRAPSKWELI